MSKPSVVGTRVLGLDIGANSVGWALANLDASSHPAGIERMGVRVFPEGVEGDLATGREQSRAVKRREARLHRRTLDRQRRRLIRIALLLQEASLLPPGEVRLASDRMAFFTSLDRSLFSADARKETPHVLLYALRARALDERLEPHQLGRALYHLAQRRGFLSNRRATARKTKDDDEGKVQSAITELAQRIEANGARTLGQYFASLDPTQERLRQRYTSRAMFEDEFDQIWQAQAPHHPGLLTAEFKRKLHRAFFFQRPLQSAKHLIGVCELEPGRRRAPWPLLCAQRFRILQTTSLLQVTAPDGAKRLLTPEERGKLGDALESTGSLTWPKVRKLLGLGKECAFNLEEGGEKTLLGNKTAARLAEAVGDDQWNAWTAEERDQVVELVRTVHDRKTLARRAMRLFGLDENAARHLAEAPLEDGYCSLSRQAIEKVLPLLAQGLPYATARKQVYGDKPGPKPVNALPRLAVALEVRNPAVERALTEVRKVVNAIVRQYGKPAFIRIELARDLKRNRKDRLRIAQRNRQNRSAREQAAEKIARDIGIKQPKGPDIEKVLLAEECGWTCPYTGKAISMDSLLGDLPQFDVEHIVPLSRCLDNSFFNKTLCDVEENRNRKRGNTPWEAYRSDPKWEDILHRVNGFHGEAAREKLARFQQETIEGLGDFTARQLNDTRYASRLAVEYLARLYGAGADGVDPDGTRRVQAGRGQVTSYLRAEWGLNTILGAGPVKERADHRQHALDAVVVALTDAGTVKSLSDAAARAVVSGRRRFAPMEAPWAGFADEVRRWKNEMVVSPRVWGRKLSGPLHEETLYTGAKLDPQGRPCVHVRKRLEDLSGADIEHIVDPKIKDLVRAKLDGGKPDKVFASPDNHPALVAKDGRRIPIHSVRIRTTQPAVPIAQGPRERHVKLGSNHHVEIVETKDKQGNPRWKGLVASTHEAMRRLRAGEPVVRRDHGPGKEFQFSLAGGEAIELDGDDGAHALYVVRTMSQSRSGYVQLSFVSINDARLKDDIRKAGAWNRALVEPLRRRGCRKVSITPLGEVRWARD